MARRSTDAGRAANVGWWRAALTPFAWLALALLCASALALVLLTALPGDPDGGAWNPAWSFAEVQLSEVGAGEARALVAEAQPHFRGHAVEWRPAERGSWIALVGPAGRQELLAALRGFLGDRGYAATQVGFGSNLARITTLLLDDPGALGAALRALLPLTLFGGGLVLLVFGAALRRRLRRAAPPAPRPQRSRVRAVLSGVALGVVLALGVEAVAAGMAALGHPVVEQAWVVGLFERGGVELYAALPMIVLVAPLAEEVFFRGYLLEALSEAWGRLGSLLLSSAAFSAVHGHGPALPAYFLYGLGLGLAARRAGTLVVPITAHITVNALGAAILWPGAQ